MNRQGGVTGKAECPMAFWGKMWAQSALNWCVKGVSLESGSSKTPLPRAMGKMVVGVRQMWRGLK